MLSRRALYTCSLLLIQLALLFSGCDSSSAVSAQKAEVPSGTHIMRTPIHAAQNGFVSVKTNAPLRLILPTIAVNTSIEDVGILPNGDLATASHHPWDDVGWYDIGPSPGERGSAVIDGHLDRPGGYPAVFWNLHKLQIGDIVIVLNTQGKTLHFRVSRIAFYTPQTAPIQEIFGNEGGSYLNLITCAGDWIPSQHQTTLRLVVYTSFAY